MGPDTDLKTSGIYMVQELKTGRISAKEEQPRSLVAASFRQPLQMAQVCKTALEIVNQITIKIVISPDWMNNFLDTAENLFSQLFHYLFSVLLFLWTLEIARFFF